MIMSLLTTFNISSIFGVAAPSLPEIDLSLKSNRHSQVKLVIIPDTHGGA